MNAVDTNILIYAHDPRDPVKRSAALTLLASLDDAVLIWQVAAEYIAACRKLEPHGYSLAHGWHDIRSLRRNWSLLRPDWTAFDTAE